MNNVVEKNFIKDFLPLFNHTLNQDAKQVLEDILCTKLSSTSEINVRQCILKELIDVKLHQQYFYYKTDYSDVFYLLNDLDVSYLKNVDVLSYTFQKSKNNQVVGHYIQLLYFFDKLYDTWQEYIRVENYPESFKNDLLFVFSYLQNFELKKHIKSAKKGKLSYRAVQQLNVKVLENRRNGDTKRFFTICNTLEAYISIAQTIDTLGFVFPEFSSTGLHITQMYHPLIQDPVKNDFDEKANTILLNGANMSGKSTFLKTLGVIVYLAHVGLAVPAEKAVLSFYDSIHIHINHYDDIFNGLSHFMQEITYMKYVLLELKDAKDVFVIFDELFNGTNYNDAIQIISSCLTGFLQFKKSTFFISSHIYELKDRFSQVDGVVSYYLDCQIVDKAPVFSYQLSPGWTDLKIGELLFEREGLNKLLLDMHKSD